MVSLRVDNDRLNKLVKQGHVLSSDSNNETAVNRMESNKNHSHQAETDQKLPSDFDDLALPAKSLGIN